MECERIFSEKQKGLFGTLAVLGLFWAFKLFLHSGLEKELLLGLENGM